MTKRINYLISIVSYHFGISEQLLKSRSRKENVVEARNVAMAILYENTNLTLSQVGSIFGRHHSTVVHSIRMTEYQHKNDLTYRFKYVDLENRFLEYGKENWCKVKAA